MYCNCCRSKFPKRKNVPFRGIAAKLCDSCTKAHHENSFSYKNEEYYCISCGDLLEKSDTNIGKVSRIRCSKCLTRSDICGLMSQNSHLVNIVDECDCVVDEKIRHHFDYDRPYDVMLLCRTCHSKEHQGFKRGKTLWKNMPQE